MTRTIVILTLLACCMPIRAELSKPEDKPAEEIRMSKPLDLSHAGLQIAIPLGFIRNELFSESMVLSTTRIDSGKANQSISVSCYPVAADVTAETLAQGILEDTKGNLTIRHLKIIKKTPIRVAGLNAIAHSLSYSQGGLETVSINLCVIRKVTPPKWTNPLIKPLTEFHLAYVVTLEVAKTHAKLLHRTFDKVAKTIVMTDFRKPIDRSWVFHGAYLKNTDTGVGMRHPSGWTVAMTPLGLSMWVTDYRLKAVPSPNVEIVSVKTAKGPDAKLCIHRGIETQRKKGFVIDILREGAITLAGKPGYQVSLRKRYLYTPEPAKEGDKPAPILVAEVFEVLRAVNLPVETELLITTPAGKVLRETVLDPTSQRHVLFVLTMLDATEAQVLKLADSLTKSMLIFTPRVQQKAEPKTTDTPKPPVKPDPKAPIEDSFKGLEG